jgi:beta-mannosidase
VPASIFAGSVKAQDYDALLTAAADAGINMLRVWAGGYYETEDFYRLCDSLGIMVWQDFMFACAYYPDRSFFLKEVEKEASDVIKRLRNHPSLVLWCGNNEIDRMHYTGKLGQGKKFYGRDIYHKLLPKIVAELDADTPYIPTTPLGDDKSFKINNPLTTHRWDVWTGFRPVSDYIRSAESDSADIAEFVTEFGLQSMPAIKMVRNFCGEENFRISNIVVERHNYQTDGNSRLCRYISDLFGPAEEPEKFVYFSQLTQARAAKLYVEFLRANNNVNGGVLFWQLNDSFPAISWSAIDFNKEPKALYYYAKRFFSGLLLTAGRDDEQETITQQVFQPTKIILVNDTAEQITANVKCSLLDLGGNILDKVTFPISASPYKTARTMKLPRAISNPSNPADCMLHLLLEKDRVRKAENFFMYLPDKYINWPAAKIQHQLTKVSQGTWKLTIKTDVFIKDLQIRCPEIVSLSDNFFDILPATNKEIIVKADAKVQPFPRSETFNFDSVNNYLLI